MMPDEVIDILDRYCEAVRKTSKYPEEQIKGAFEHTLALFMSGFQTPEGAAEFFKRETIKYENNEKTNTF